MWEAGGPVCRPYSNPIYCLIRHSFAVPPYPL